MLCNLFDTNAVEISSPVTTASARAGGRSEELIEGFLLAHTRHEERGPPTYHAVFAAGWDGLVKSLDFDCLESFPVLPPVGVTR